jgi:5-methylcytosine-specific restriction endonuclease McrA
MSQQHALKHIETQSGSRPRFEAQIVTGSRDITPATVSKRVLLRPCAHPGCAELVQHGRCDAHRRAQQQEHDRDRGNSRARGYDMHHRRLRPLCFQRDAWRCVDCGWEPELVRLFREVELGPPPTEQVLEELRRAFARGDRHLHADHQIPIELRPDLRLDLDNLRTRCDRCHRAKTMRETGRDR